MIVTDYDRLVAELRDAIARRDALAAGSPAHWRASCEARALMKRVAAAAAGPVPAPAPGAVAAATSARDPIPVATSA